MTYISPSVRTLIIECLLVNQGSLFHNSPSGKRTMLDMMSTGREYTTYSVSLVYNWSIFTMYWPQIAFFALIGKE